MHSAKASSLDFIYSFSLYIYLFRTRKDPQNLEIDTGLMKLVKRLVEALMNAREEGGKV